MTPDFRALCAELADAYLRTLEHINNSTWLGYEPSDEPLLQRARALLAEPVAEGPTEPTTNDQPPVVIVDSMETLPLRMLDAFWSFANNLMPIGSPDRMREVLRLLANEIETWAPSYTESKICHLAVTEVAQRLRAEADQ